MLHNGERVSQKGQNLKRFEVPLIETLGTEWYDHILHA